MAEHETLAVRLRTEDELVAYLNHAHRDDGTAWPWRADSTSGPEGYELALYTVAGTTLEAVEAILGYVWAGPMQGEWWPGEGEELLPGHLYRFPLDTTKSGRDDVGIAWDEHRSWLVEGTPVRKTDRAGEGTRGTRKHEGLGPVLLAWR